jgi:hypothetical protein
LDLFFSSIFFLLFFLRDAVWAIATTNLQQFQVRAAGFFPQTYMAQASIDPERITPMVNRQASPEYFFVNKNKLIQISPWFVKPTERRAK